MAKRAPKPRPATVLAVAVGGALGALARVVLPWPTLFDGSLAAIDPLPSAIVNVLGAALLGLVTGYTAGQPLPEPLVKGTTTGFLSAFTTMSTLAVVYSGLTLGQAAFMTGSPVEAVVRALLILAILMVFLLVTTYLTVGTIKCGKRLARRRS